jgi:esterase/lipase superfamily enzyme
MKRELTSWYSPSLNKEMPIASYGDYGFALLLVPTAAADYLEYERFQLMDHIAPFINSGKVRVFSIDSINNESWLNNQMDPRHKSIRHQQWNDYVFNEVVPFIKNTTSQETPIITCGASFGALHSMNLFLKRPDIINGVIAMSGVYDLSEYTKGHFDDDAYFNSPWHFMQNLTDHSTLEQIRQSKISIFSLAVVLMKTLRQVENLLKSFMTRACGMSWMYGGRTGRMTGIPGGLCYLIISGQGFKVCVFFY